MKKEGIFIYYLDKCNDDSHGSDAGDVFDYHFLELVQAPGCVDLVGNL